MSYADLTYYKNTYLGEDPSDDTLLQKYLDRATDDIDILVGGPIDTSEFGTTQLGYLKKANCSQAEFYVVNGEVYNDGTPTSETIGRYSHNGGSPSEGAGMLCQRARNYLSLAGCGNAATRVLGRGVYYESTY